MPSHKACWDACVFSSVLDGGRNRTPEEIAGLGEVVDLVDRRALLVITSSLVETEVLGDVANPAIRSLLEQLFLKPNIVQVAASAEVMRKAGAIRQAARSRQLRVATPDAVYLATAILHRADELHTFDDRLLRLSGSHVIDGLTVCKPRGAQTLLGL